MLPRVAVLIPSKNDENFLATTLLSIFHEAADYQALGGAITMCVVNDGSTDRTAAVIDGMRHLSPARFTVISRTESKGTAYSLSEAFVACAGGSDVVLRADADARFIQSGWLRQMVSFLTSDPRIGIVAPLSVFPDGTIDSHGVNYLPAGRAIELRDQEYGAQPILGIAEVDAVLGVYSLTRARDWEIDPSYSAWRDDEDQSLALRRRGLKCFSMGSLAVVNYHPMRWARVSDRITIMGWQRRQSQQQRPQVQPGRWTEIRNGTELLAAGVLPAFAKQALRRFVPPAPAPARPESPSPSAKLEAAWLQNSQHFAHKWGFPSPDPWTHVPPAEREWPPQAAEALAQSRAANLLRGRYTDDGMAAAREIVERYLRTPQRPTAR